MSQEGNDCYPPYDATMKDLYSILGKVSVDHKLEPTVYNKERFDKNIGLLRNHLHLERMKVRIEEFELKVLRLENEFYELKINDKF